MSYQIHQVDWCDESERLKELREKVFVCEYHIPRSIEFDKLDIMAQHVLLTNDNKAVIATARLSNDGLMSRVAVIASHRNQAVYKTLFSFLVTVAEQQGLDNVSFNCILDERDKFLQVGFKQQGEVFMEAGIPRQRLFCPIKNFNAEPFSLVH